MEYQILSGQSNRYNEAISKLSHKVNDALKEGWICQGGVSISITHYEWYIASQAVIKSEQKAEIVPEVHFLN